MNPYSVVINHVRGSRVLALLAMTALLFSVAPVAQAQVANNTSIDITDITPDINGGCFIIGQTVTVSGEATADAPPGKLSQYHVQIDWGDGSSDDQAESSAFGLGNEKGQATRSFSGTHAYTSAATTTITARIYHQNPPGNDGQADAVESIDVCIKVEDPETATLTIEKVVIGGSATTSTFAFAVNGGSSEYFESDGSNAVELELGDYDVVETGITSGKITIGDDTYLVSYGTGCSGVLTLDGATCVITNTLEVPGVEYGTLQVVKLIVGTTSATYADFGFEVSGTATSSASFEVDGSNDLVVEVGTYNVVETEAVGFITTYDNCDNMQVTVGSTTTCTITNTVSDERFTLTIALSGDGQGHVLSDDESISCYSEPQEGVVTTDDCSETYPVGTVVTLNASAHTGSNFDNSWAQGFGTCTGNTSPCQVTITEDINLDAHFALNTTSSGGGGGGRSSKKSSSDDSSTPDGQVLGESTSVMPLGAPNTGAGGTAPVSVSLPSLTAILSGVRASRKVN